MRPEERRLSSSSWRSTADHAAHARVVRGQRGAVHDGEAGGCAARARRPPARKSSVAGGCTARQSAATSAWRQDSCTERRAAEPCKVGTSERAESAEEAGGFRELIDAVSHVAATNALQRLGVSRGHAGSQASSPSWTASRVRSAAQMHVCVGLQFRRRLAAHEEHASHPARRCIRSQGPARVRDAARPPAAPTARARRGRRTVDKDGRRTTLNHVHGPSGADSRAAQLGARLLRGRGAARPQTV